MKLVWIALFILITAFTAFAIFKKEPPVAVNEVIPVAPDTILQRTKPLIIIDAGHGGRDPGAVNDSLKLYEKNLTRKITDALLKKLDTSLITPVETRVGDEFTDRHIRIQNANRYRPDMLLTIHINFDEDTLSNGFEVSFNDTIIDKFTDTDTFKIANPNKQVLKKYGNIIHQKIAKSFPMMKPRGIKIRKDDIWMIYAPKYPSLLLEFGFISNRKDLTVLQNDKQIQKLAETLKHSLYEIFKIKS